MARGRSKEALAALRRKFGLGEFSGGKRARVPKPKSTFPAMTREQAVDVTADMRFNPTREKEERAAMIKKLMRKPRSTKRKRQTITMKFAGTGTGTP